MDLKKVLDQTVRELKREVNKKVLKVPEIEQKVLEATSNEAWGPHGTLMADIAQATRNYNECQMIMSILWKRVNDTGRNWRHVYKALTVLEFLVAHGSERVIDELREHAYQISTLTDFQYVESSGRDQGINVRKKAQTLVALVNDKEKIREVRQKAVTNRDKYRGVSSTGGIYKPSSYSSTGAGYGGDRYDDDRSTGRYGSRDDDRYGYSRDRDDYRSRDEDRYGRDVDDRYGREGDRHGKDGDRYRDDYNGDHDQEEDRYSSRRGDRQLDKDRDRPSDDEDRYSSRSGGGRGDDYGHDDRRSDRKPSAARSSAPPSYEEVAYGGNDGRDSGGLAAAVARAAKPSGRSQTEMPSTTLDSSNNKSIRAGNQSDDFDDFDPRGSAVVAPSVAPASNDFFGQTIHVATVTPGAPSDDFFGQTGQVEPSSITKALPPAPSLSSVPSIGSDLFGESNFGSSFMVPPVSGPSAPTKQLNGNLFGDSGFEIEPTTSSNLFPATVQSSASKSTFMQTSFSSTVGFGDSSNEGFSTFGTVTAKPTSATLVGTDPFGGDSFNAFGAVPAGSTNISSSPIVLNQVQHSKSTEPNNASNAVQYVKPQQRTDKFETKSKVWADTLSKGLIDLNIAGPKSNPLAELGIDFDLLRTERKREEKTSTTTVNKGKAMGSGSGIGLAGASALAPPPGPAMMGGVGMGMGPGMGMGMGPNMGLAGNPGMGMMTPMGMGPGSGMGMGMNPMMGMTMGGYLNQQQQYGGFR